VRPAPAPRVALLGVGDALQLPCGTLLHLTAYVRPRIEAPAGALLERRCGLCLGALSASSRVYVCPCGTPLHLEEAGAGTGPVSGPAAGPCRAGEPLQCALLGDCPACQRPVRTESGFTWLPALRGAGAAAPSRLRHPGGATAPAAPPAASHTEVLP